MTESLAALKQLLDQCSDMQRAALLDYLKVRLPQHPLEKEWGVGAEIILSAIARSSDLTKRGIRGIIAEAVFERHVLGELRGWKVVPFVEDKAYDFLLHSGGEKLSEARIQIKLQRMQKQQPMMASEAKRYYPKDSYVVEVQKTRGGVDRKTNEKTRPYRFGEFDILAVNMHPSTRDWNGFRYTLGASLIPRSENEALIEIFQPVSLTPNDAWTDSLTTCLEWLVSGDRKKIFEIKPAFLVQPVQKKRGKKKRKRKEKFKP